MIKLLQGDCIEQMKTLADDSVVLTVTWNENVWDENVWSSAIKEIVYGSGTTGVACKNTNRNFIGIEKDDKYFEIAEKRINTPNKLEDI